MSGKLIKILATPYLANLANVLEAALRLLMAAAVSELISL